MLEILQKEGLTDVLCVVTRYFGGTVLGTGGVVRAYSSSLKDSIEQSIFEEETKAVIAGFRYAYSYDAKIQAYLRDNSIKVLSNEYSNAVDIKLAVIKEKYPDIKESLVDITNGSASITEESECMYAF